MRIVAWAEVVKEDTSRAHDRDNYGYYRGYEVTAPVFSLSVHVVALQIRCFLIANAVKPM